MATDVGKRIDKRTSQKIGVQFKNLNIQLIYSVLEWIPSISKKSSDSSVFICVRDETLE